MLWASQANACCMSASPVDTSAGGGPSWRGVVEPHTSRNGLLALIEHVSGSCSTVERRLGGYGVPVEPSCHRIIRNEPWPKYAENFPVREPIPVLASILFARGWPPAFADRWNQTYVRVVLDPPVHGRDVLWLHAHDVRRRDA